MSSTPCSKWTSLELSERLSETRPPDEPLTEPCRPRSQSLPSNATPPAILSPRTGSALGGPDSGDRGTACSVRTGIDSKRGALAQIARRRPVENLMSADSTAGGPFSALKYEKAPGQTRVPKKNPRLRNRKNGAPRKIRTGQRKAGAEGRPFSVGKTFFYCSRF